jgi:hypothetical protein
MRTYLTRLRRLEKANGNRCPFCAGQKPIMLRGAEQEAPSCPACGRRLPAVKLIRDSDFYTQRRPPARERLQWILLQLEGGKTSLVQRAPVDIRSHISVRPDDL